MFLEFVGLTEKEFHEIAESHMVSPHKHDSDAVISGTKITDFDQWSRDGEMSREEGMQQVKNWRKRNSQ